MKMRFEIPDYLTIAQYKQLVQTKETSNVVQLAKTVSVLTGKPYEEVRMWSVDSIVKVSDLYKDLADYKESFFPLIEWNGTLYGFSSLKNATLGEFIDLENICKDDINQSLNKIASLLYRPVTKHRFDNLQWNVRQSIKVLKNEVSNPFDWYEIEEYNSKIVKDRHKEFDSFPVHLALGAISFFLNIGSLYLNHTQYSNNPTMKKTIENSLTQLLSQNTGGGSGLYTRLQKQTSYS